MIYFDTAATSRFKPAGALKAFWKAQKHIANSGRSGHEDAVMLSEGIERTRSFLLSALGGEKKHELAFTKNCTEALNLAILGACAEGCEVITTVFEHNSVLRPLYKLKKDNKIILHIVNPDKSGKINPEHIERLINGNTGLLAVNYVSNVTGTAIDLTAVGRIAQKYNLRLLLDGAQGVPHLPLNLNEMGITFLACAGHKGLHGMQGTGFLAFDKSIKIKPLIFGGTGTNSDSVYQPTSYPESLESGTLNAPAIIALGEAAKWTYDNLEKINLKTERLTAKLLYGIKNIRQAEVYTPDGCHNGVIAFNLGRLTSSELGDTLNFDYGIGVRTGLHCAPLAHNYLGTLERGAVRVSVGWHNTDREADYLLNAINAIARR